MKIESKSYKSLLRAATTIIWSPTAKATVDLHVDFRCTYRLRRCESTSRTRRKYLKNLNLERENVTWADET